MALQTYWAVFQWGRPFSPTFLGQYEHPAGQVILLPPRTPPPTMRSTIEVAHFEKNVSY
ncbi:unnamed protein product [Laminaria digitata]